MGEIYSGGADTEGVRSFGIMSALQPTAYDTEKEKRKSEEERVHSADQVHHGPAESLTDDDVPTEEEYKLLRK